MGRGSRKYSQLTKKSQIGGKKLSCEGGSGVNKKIKYAFVKKDLEPRTYH